MRVVLEDPPYEIRPRITRSEFLNSFPNNRLLGRRGTRGGLKGRKDMFLSECILPGGFRCIIYFIFGKFPKESPEPLLYEISLSLGDWFIGGLKESYEHFQSYLESIYGPGESTGISEGFTSFRWVLRDELHQPVAEVKHYVFDRFGPEEHVLITF